jgi:hypothetical protein
MAIKDFGLGVAVPLDDDKIGYVVSIRVVEERVEVNFPIPDVQNPIARVPQDFVHCQMYSGAKLTVMNYRPYTGADGTQYGQHGTGDVVLSGAYLEHADMDRCKIVSCISPSVREFLNRAPVTKNSTKDFIKVDMSWRDEIVSRRTTPAGWLRVSIVPHIRGDVRGTTISEQVSLEHESDDVTRIVERFTFLLSFHQLALILTRHIEAAHSLSCTIIDGAESLRCDLCPPLPEESKPQVTYGSRRITLSDTGLNLETLLENWIGLAGRIAPSLGIFERWLTTRSHKPLNETDLIMLVQSHEIYFNRLYGDSGPSELWRKLEKLIGSWLIVFGFTNSELTCKDIANTRNWFTHFNPKYDGQEKVKSYANMDTFGMLLQITYPALLLKLVNAPQDHINEYLKRASAEHASYF